MPLPPNTLKQLFIAIMHNDHRTIYTLCEKFGGKLVNQSGEYGQTPLFVAADYASGTATWRLLKYGAKPNTADIWKNTPLHKASIRNAGHIASQLIAAISQKEQATYVNQPDAMGCSALFIAVKENYSAIAQILLDAKANKMLQNWPGNTALHYVKNVDMVNLLLQKECAINILRMLSTKNHAGQTAENFTSAPKIAEHLNTIKEETIHKLKTDFGYVDLHVFAVTEDYSAIETLLESMAPEERLALMDTKTNEELSAQELARSPIIVELLQKIKEEAEKQIQENKLKQHDTRQQRKRSANNPITSAAGSFFGDTNKTTKKLPRYHSHSNLTGAAAFEPPSPTNGPIRTA